MTDLRTDIEKAIKAEQYRDESRARARKLRADVANTSSESSRMFQTLNHLAGKSAGEAADASIRHRENMKESQAEDEEVNAFLNAQRARAARKAADKAGGKKK